ncbi:MAG: hypothetical protein INR63_19015 [Actinomycetospora chiangmaiensis]|nr:hypothetical protein [Actinomycetospora chiangmaiensis]
MDDADHVGRPGADAADAAQDCDAFGMRQPGQFRAEQTRRLRRDDRLQGADLVARDAAGPQAIRVAGREQRARMAPGRDRSGLDPCPDRRRGPGGELLVYHRDEQAFGDARMRRRPDPDRAGPRQGVPQGWIRAGRRQEMGVDGGIEGFQRATPFGGVPGRSPGASGEARLPQKVADLLKPGCSR